MIDIEATNLGVLVNRVGKMIGRITYFGGVEMPKELSDWQTTDVHRKRPATKRSKWRGGSIRVQTLFRPHSRYETERSAAYQKRLLRRLRRIGKTKRFKQISDYIQLRRSRRPILRESAIDQLRDRMVRALHETVNWTP